MRAARSTRQMIDDAGLTTAEAATVLGITMRAVERACCEEERTLVRLRNCASRLGLYRQMIPRLRGIARAMKQELEEADHAMRCHGALPAVVARRDAALRVATAIVQEALGWLRRPTEEQVRAWLHLVEQGATGLVFTQPRARRARYGNLLAPRVLAALEPGEHLAARDLAGRLGLSPQQVGRSCGWLRNLGLMARDDDGRWYRTDA